MMEEVVKETAGVRNTRKWKTFWFHDLARYRLHVHEQIGLNLGLGDAKLGDAQPPLFPRTVYDPSVYRTHMPEGLSKLVKTPLPGRQAMSGSGSGGDVVPRLLC